MHHIIKKGLKMVSRSDDILTTKKNGGQRISNDPETLHKKLDIEPDEPH